MAATVESTFRLINLASRELREIKNDAQQADRALLRMGASGDLASKQVGGHQSQGNYSNAERSLGRLEQQATKTGMSFGFLHSKILLIASGLTALAPLLVQSVGVLGQLGASLLGAVGGAGVIGGGLLGAAVVGFGSVFAVMKDGLSAVTNANKAFTQYNAAVTQYGAKSRQAATAAAALNQQLKDAPAHTLALLNNLKALGDQWDRLTAKSQGQVVGLANYAVGQLSSSLPQITSQIINPSMSAFSQAGKGFIDRLLSPASLGIMQQLATGFTRMIGPMADVVANLAQALGRLAVIALPFAEQFVHSLDRWSQRFELTTRDTDYFHTIFARLVAEFRTWMGFFGAVLHFFETFTLYAQGGRREIQGITDALDRWTQWMKDNPGRVMAFFSTASRTAGDLGRALKFVFDLFAGLNKTMEPTWLLLRQLLGDIGRPLLQLLLTVTRTISIITQQFGAFGGPLVILIKAVNAIVTGFNWLLQHVPFLASLIAGGLMIAGLIRMGTAIWNFVSGIGRSITGMATLTSETNAAAAATERLAAASRATGFGGGGGGAAPFGVYRSRYPSGVVPYGSRALDEVPMVTPKGGMGLSTGGKFLTGAETLGGAGLLARGAGMLGRFAEGANPYGMALLLGSSLLSMAPSGIVPGGHTTTSIMGDVATGAGLGALPGIFGGPIGIGVGSLIGGAGGLGYGIYKHLFSGGGGSGDPIVNAIVNGSQGDAAARSLADQRGTLGAYNRSMLPLQAQLGAAGGSNPRTPEQFAAQVSALNTALHRLTGDQSSQAVALRTSITEDLRNLLAMQKIVDAQAKHQQFTGAMGLAHQIGLGATVIDKSKGPGAAMDFVLTQTLARWDTLGPEGKKKLAAAVVEWEQEVVKQRPGLKKHLDELLDSPVGKMIEVNGKIVNQGHHVVTNLTAAFNHTSALLKRPVEQAREEVSAQLTIIQQQMVALYIAMGIDPATAHAIVAGQDSAGASAHFPVYLQTNISGIPAGMTGPTGGKPSRRAKKAGGPTDGGPIDPHTGAHLGPVGPSGPQGTGHAMGGRIGGFGTADSVHLGGGMFAAPGELIVNRHTEARVNQMLGPGMSLAGMIGQESRPHGFAGGGRIPDFTGLTGAGLSGSALTGVVPYRPTTGLGGVANGTPGSGGTYDALVGLSAAGLSGGFSGTANTMANQRAGYQMMMAMGWGADQWPALKALWNGESGWSQFAYNSSSGATGIPQSLPGDKMASAGADWRTNPITQMRWGLNYIQGRYGSPSSAYSQWLARSPHWYGKGGDFVARRPQLIGVGDGGPERVTITPLGRGRATGMTGQPIQVTVHIGRIDASGSPDAVRSMVSGQIRDAIAEVSDELARMGHVPDEHLATG